MLQLQRIFKLGGELLFYPDIYSAAFSVSCQSANIYLMYCFAWWGLVFESKPHPCKCSYLVNSCLRWAVLLAASLWFQVFPSIPFLRGCTSAVWSQPRFLCFLTKPIHYWAKPCNKMFDIPACCRENVASVSWIWESCTWKVSCAVSSKGAWKRSCLLCGGAILGETAT